MATTPRLRQVALVAERLEPAAAELRRALDLGEPFADVGVEVFGLEDAVFATGDSFLEVVAPVRQETAAGRQLQRLGGDGGYMAIFEVSDLDAARRRVEQLGVRVVWSADLEDIAGSHLHPADVPGAIVSLDQPRPAGSWRWAGPAWAGQIPPHPPGGITGLTVTCHQPAAVARRWAEVLDLTADPGSGASQMIALDDGRQQLRFVPGSPDRPQTISEVTVTPAAGRASGARTVEVAGVRLVIEPVPLEAT